MAEKWMQIKQQYSEEAIIMVEQSTMMAVLVTVYTQI